MNLPKLALIGVIIAGALYVLLALIGIAIAGPAGIFGLIVLAFVATLFFGVLSQRLKNEEDDYYEKNIHD